MKAWIAIHSRTNAPLILPIQTPVWQELPNEIGTSLTSLLTRLLLDHAQASGAVSPTEINHDL
jgi:hypothetical protein